MSRAWTSDPVVAEAYSNDIASLFANEDLAVQGRDMRSGAGLGDIEIPWLRGPYPT
jgi:hypothetical protein